MLMASESNEVFRARVEEMARLIEPTVLPGNGAQQHVGAVRESCVAVPCSQWIACSLARKRIVAGRSTGTLSRSEDLGAVAGQAAYELAFLKLGSLFVLGVVFLAGQHHLSGGGGDRCFVSKGYGP